MLSQSDLFNRLPLSEDQKKELYFKMLNESRKGQTHPEDNSRTLAEPDSHSQSEHEAQQEDPLEETQPERGSVELPGTPAHSPLELCHMQTD